MPKYRAQARPNVNTYMRQDTSASPTHNFFTRRTVPAAYQSHFLITGLTTLEKSAKQRNSAEARINAMRANGWQAESIAAVTGKAGTTDEEEAEGSDLEQLAQDQIAQLIAARFKGHGLTRLVEAILRSQGYTTYRSPEGADAGVDILAGAGQLGCSLPKLCVEVKSESSPIDRPTVDKLLGAVARFGPQEGLFVSWSGFQTNVPKEMAASFFRVRLWTKKELLELLFNQYDRLDEDIRAELPLKRIWTVTVKDE